MRRATKGRRTDQDGPGPSREAAEPRRSRRIRAVLELACAATLLATSGAYAAVGDLTQKPGTPGCVSETGTGGACQDGVALVGAQDVAVSPDGASVYVASGSAGVAIFDRNTSTGELTQKPGTAGCVSETGTGGACQDGVALDDSRRVAVSPDGASVYVASGFPSHAVAVFDRDPTTGELTQKPGTAGCVSETGTGGACQDGVALDPVRDVAVSPDGASVYVSGGAGVAIFDRNTSTGELTQKPGTAGCIGPGGACQDGVEVGGSVAVSPDGASVYTADLFSVAILDRDLTTGALTQKPAPDGCIGGSGDGLCQVQVEVVLYRARDLAVSPDGASVYVVSFGGLDPGAGAIAIFDRDPTGALTQKGCVSAVGGGACQDGVAIDSLVGVAVSPDGTSVYTATPFTVGATLFDPGAVAIFDRNPTTGALTQKPGTAGCVSETGTGGACQDGVALSRTNDVAVSPDGASVYATSGDAIAIFDRELWSGPPPPPPSSKEQCKNGGWRNFPQFKNQGRCIKFVTHGP